MDAFPQECIQNAFRMHSSPNLRSKIYGESRFKTKNQEPRFPQDSWANLGSIQNQEPRTKIPPGLLSKSWFLVLGFGSNQDLLRSPGGILVLGSWFWFEPRFAQESWVILGSWSLALVRTKICSGVLGKAWFLVLGFSRECILNAFFPECYLWSLVQSVSIAYLLHYWNIYIYIEYCP